MVRCRVGGRVYVEMYYPKSNQTEPHSNITNPTELVTTFSSFLTVVI